MSEYISLDKLKLDERGKVLSVSGSPSLCERLCDLGLVPNTEIVCVMRAPLGDPTAFLFRGTLMALRREDCKAVMISAEDTEGR